MGKLDGKVALITGAGRGIGAAVARAYAAEGARVVCAARSRNQVEKVAAEVSGLAVVCDVTDHEAVKAMHTQAVERFGGLDIVVANAGGSLDRSRLDEGTAEGWVATIELNLIGAFYTMREAVPYLKQRGAGKIITVGSGMGHRGAAGNSSYAAAKAGLWSLTRVLAQELAEFNISVNELIPGPVRTQLTVNVEKDAAKKGHTTPFLTAGEWIKQPEDVAGLAMFMATMPNVGPTAQSFSLMRRDG